MALITDLEKVQKEFDACWSQKLAGFERRLDAIISPGHPTVVQLQEEFRAFRELVTGAIHLLGQQIRNNAKVLDAMDMQSRQKILLFSGITEDPEDKVEQKVLDLLHSKMGLTQVTALSFQRCHQFGPQEKGCTRFVLVHFHDLRTKADVWRLKGKLKGTQVSISEFLTKPRQEIHKRAKKYYGLRNVWTLDGKINIKVPDGSRVKIFSEEELDTCMANHPVSSSSADSDDNGPLDEGHASQPTAESSSSNPQEERQKPEAPREETKRPRRADLRRVAVHDVASLLSVVSEGARRRRTAATRRNSTSSRSHALLELATPRATLHLADLAGSEKASWEGCGGGRQKEGANINKSLVALSNVISALVSGGRARYVPYRDSALTWLLKDCFTGGAPTFIIATVSPSIACYGESASTLRWAERARQLPVQRPTLNSSGPSRAVLQAQFHQLIAELASQYIRYIPETGKISYDDGHWTLIKRITPCEEDKEINIGNIMSISFPKVDVPTSESTPSSVASSSSDVINIMDKNEDISSEISKEVDKIFGPTLERTSSGIDLKIIAPDKNIRRQYRSQEVLPIDKTLQLGQSSILCDVNQSFSEVRPGETQSNDDNKITPVPIVYDSNQRADIIESVTERLYSKLKKKDLSVSKIDTVVDKKVPLNELRICTNARQRLVELSQKALRNKRKIGIPVHTQTRKTVIRVKDQEIDVQNDLELYVINKKRAYLLYRDVCTETTPITPRYKEIGVGPIYGSLHVNDKFTITENEQVVHRNFATMTDKVKKVNHSTQTPATQPLRRKKRSAIYGKFNSIYGNLMRKIEKVRNNLEETPPPPIININISPSYPQDSESSDDNQDTSEQIKKHVKTSKSSLTPDLLTNHSNDKKDKKEKKSMSLDDIDKNVDDTDDSILIFDDRESLQLIQTYNDEFPETEENVLPRVVISTPSSPLPDPTEIKDMILGRSVNSYPYNIILSPSKPKDETKRIIKFKEIDITPAECCNLKSDDDDTDCKFGKGNWVSYKDSRESLYSDCSSSSKIEPELFTWRKGGVANQSTNTTSSLRRNYLTLPRSNVTYKMARSKIYKEFLGLDRELQQDEECLQSSLPTRLDVTDDSENVEECTAGSEDVFRKRRQFFEKKFSRGYYPQRETFSNIERKIIKSCNKLELSTNRYEDYLNEYKENKYARNGKDLLGRTPTEYLKHLVQLRRDVILANSHRTESFV